MVKKEPVILEKDKEDRTKYYLRYPKPPVLDLKWANGDVNVVEWANIPKFSDSCQTSRIILCDVLADMIFGYIKLYSREIRHGS